MAEINIIKIDGKPLEKLIEVISKGIGKLYQPKEIRNVADAEAYKIGVIERAKVNAKVESEEIDLESKIKIENRLAHKESKRQINIENIVYRVAEQLQHETEVSDEPIADDWITRFFNTAQDISNEEMQTLWSRILAGEIKRPNSFSLRTLDFLKNLSQEDAELLTKISKFSLKVAGTNTIYYKPLHEIFRDNWGLQYLNFLYLIELGILNPNDSDFNLKNKKESELWIENGKKAIVIKRKIEGTLSVFTGTTFTKIGTELLKLIERNPNEEYLEKFIKNSINGRKDIEVKVGHAVKNENGKISYDNFKEMET